MVLVWPFLPSGLNTTQPLRDLWPAPSIETMSQLPTSHPAYWIAPGWLIHQSHSRPWELREFLHNNTLCRPQSLLCSSSPLSRRRHQQVISDYTEEKCQVQASIILWLLLLPQENDPRVRVSTHSASLWYVFLLSKGCFSDPMKKRTGEGGAGFKWREN